MQGDTMTEKQLQILLPMGGLGQRFRDEGYVTPKPLIEVEGRRMFLRALSSFDVVNQSKSIMFVVRQDAEDEYGLATSIRDIMPDAKLAMLESNTQGATETALVARDLIDPDNPLIIMDCDFEFTSKEYFSYVEEILQGASYDGVLLSFKSENPRYSYAKVAPDGFVTETAEKVVISNNALWGAYCFASGRLFLEYANRLIEKGLSEQRKEFYVSYVYAEMLADGRKIKLATTDSSNSFGTPTELNEYLRSRQ
jgi:dTDP-glucose pyrophosphorylase